MATWTMHLAIAKEIEDRLNIKNKNQFYFGNVVPDLERWVVTNLDTFVDYNDSHYIKNNINSKKTISIDLDKFYKLNQVELKKQNSLILGYYCHLIVDDYLNNVISSDISIFDDKNNFIGVFLNNGKILKCDKEKRRKLKHREYELFNKYLVNNFKIQSPVYNKDLVNSVKNLKNIYLSEKDIKKIVMKCIELTQINNFKDTNYDYEIYTEDILLKYYNNAIEYILKVLMEKELIK